MGECEPALSGRVGVDMQDIGSPDARFEVHAECGHRRCAVLNELSRLDHCVKLLPLEGRENIELLTEVSVPQRITASMRQSSQASHALTSFEWL